MPEPLGQGCHFDNFSSRDCHFNHCLGVGQKFWLGQPATGLTMIATPSVSKSIEAFALRPVLPRNLITSGQLVSASTQVIIFFDCMLHHLFGSTSNGLSHFLFSRFFCDRRPS